MAIRANNPVIARAKLGAMNFIVVVPLSSRTTCAHYLTVELSPCRNRPWLTDTARLPKIALSLRDAWYVRCCRFNFMARPTQHAAVLKSCFTAQSIRYLVVIMKVPSE